MSPPVTIEMWKTIKKLGREWSELHDGRGEPTVIPHESTEYFKTTSIM